MSTVCFCTHTRLNLNCNANVQGNARVSPLDQSVSFCMLQGSWESENETPHLLPLRPPPPPPYPHRVTPPPHPPSPSPSSSDTSSWQPAPFNSLQHSLGLGNHWCSAPSVSTTPAPSLVELSHLGPYDGALLGGVFLRPRTAQRCCEK